jgi:hypothetical protein
VAADLARHGSNGARLGRVGLLDRPATTQLGLTQLGSEPLTKRLRQWRRLRVRPLWHSFRPVAILAFVSVVVVLGTVGYLSVEDKDYSPFDAFYLSLTLFTMGGNVDPPVPTELQIARIVAPIVTGYAVIQAVLLLFRENMQLLRVRLTMRGHVVIAGLGASGYRLARALDDAGYPVVGVESDARNPAIGACRERGVSTVTGDATDPIVLKRAQLRRATHLVAMCGDDRVDMDVAAAASDLSAVRPAGALTAMVALDDLRLWRTLSARLLAQGSSDSFRLTLFQLHETAARVLVEEHPPFPRESGDEAGHIALIGVDGVGESLLLHLGRLWLARRRDDDDRLRVTLLAPDAFDAARLLDERHPRLREVCNVLPQTTAVEPTTLSRAAVAARAEGGPISSLYVCRDDESEALAAGLALGARPEFAGVRVIVTVMDANAGIARAIRTARRRGEDVVPFGVLTAALTPDLLFGGVNEVLARATHDAYVRAQLSTGEASTNPRAIPWTELSDYYREENRAFADGTGAKLRAVGCMLVPAPLAALAEFPFEFSEAERERLAVEEHRRWRERHERAGWRYGPVVDEQRRLHPGMVDWEQLSETERAKDRDLVAALPAMLAEAGFGVVPIPKAGDGSLTRTSATSR